MSEMWAQNKPLIVAALVWLGGSLLLFLAVYLPSSGAASALDADAAPPGSARLDRHYARGGEIPSGAKTFDKAKTVAEAEQAALAQAFDEAWKQVEFKPRPAFTIGRDAGKRADKYMAVRKKMTDDLQGLARAANVEIPKELDPRLSAKGLPRAEEVDELLFGLAMADRLVRAAIAAKVPRVASVVHTPGATQKAPFAQRLVTVVLEGELKDVIGFIEACSRPPGKDENAGGGILLLRAAELSAAGGKGSRLRATVELAAASLAEVKPKARAPLNVTQ